MEGPVTQLSHTVVILAAGVFAPRFLKMGYDTYCGWAASKSSLMAVGSAEMTSRSKGALAKCRSRATGSFAPILYLPVLAISPHISPA